MRVSFNRNGNQRLVESLVPPELPLLLIKVTWEGKPEAFDISINRDGLGVTEDSRKAKTSLERIKVTYPTHTQWPQMSGCMPDGLSFAIGVQIQGGKIKRNGVGRWTVLPSHNEVLISAAVEVGYDANKVKAHLPLLAQRGLTERHQLEQRHTREWKNFWTQSGIAMPADEFLEDLWHLDLYLLNSTLKYAQLAPGLFGLWSYMDVLTTWQRMKDLLGSYLQIE